MIEQKAIVTFDVLFKKLTGMHPDDAQVGEDGFIFIPFSEDISQNFEKETRLISELAGPNGWRNHLVNGEYAGWWIRRPE